MAERPASGNGQRSEDRRGITALSVSGFKSLASAARVEVRGLTILAGPNSSGKSSVMQPLLLLKQTLEAAYDPGPLQLDGSNVRFTKAQQMFARHGARSHADSCEFGLEVDGNTSIVNKYLLGARNGLQLSETRSSRDGHELVLRESMTDAELRSILPVDVITDTQRASSGHKMTLGVLRSRCFLGIANSHDSAVWVDLWSPAGPAIYRHIQQVIHLPGLRGNPERTYPTAAIGDTFPGLFQHYVASVINHWQASNDDRLGLLGADLQALGLTWQVRAEPLDDTQVELQVGRLPRATKGGAQDLVSIADVGVGVSQTLPVLVALRVARPGQLVYLEQPEIHLHPRAQVAMAGLLADAVARGVRVVVETHSALLLLGVQTLVASGQLAAGHVKLHWFQRDANGNTEVSSRDLDETGAFGDWPEDFADVSLEAESNYLKFAEAKLARAG